MVGLRSIWRDSPLWAGFSSYQQSYGASQPMPRRLQGDTLVQLFGGANGGGLCPFADSGARCPPPSLTSRFGEMTTTPSIRILVGCLALARAVAPAESLRSAKQLVGRWEST